MPYVCYNKNGKQRKVFDGSKFKNWENEVWVDPQVDYESANKYSGDSETQFTGGYAYNDKFTDFEKDSAEDLDTEGLSLSKIPPARAVRRKRLRTRALAKNYSEGLKLPVAHGSYWIDCIDKMSELEDLYGFEYVVGYYLRSRWYSKEVSRGNHKGRPTQIGVSAKNPDPDPGKFFQLLFLMENRMDDHLASECCNSHPGPDHVGWEFRKRSHRNTA